MREFYYIAAVYGSGAYGECDYNQASAACSSITAPGTGSAQQPAQTDNSFFLVLAITLVALGCFVLTVAQMIRRRARLAAARAAAEEKLDSEAS